MTKKPEVENNPVAAIFAATLVTLIVSASYPFMTLKLGLTPGMAVPGALLGFFFMRIRYVNFFVNRSRFCVS